MKLMKKKHGFSLLELLLVVAVGAVLLLAGLAVYRNVTQNANVNEAMRLLNVIKQETQRLFQGEGEYGTADLNSLLQNANVIPSSALNGTEIRHPFNDTVTVTGVDDTFTILFRNVPRAACISLGQSYNGDDPDFVQLEIRTTTITGDVSVTDLDTACNRDVQNMTWTFF
jgi:prepilin-type N-terminal cleavage/methylation domain-containing protein